MKSVASLHPAFSDRLRNRNSDAHVTACRWLLVQLETNGNATLRGLFDLVQDSGRCLDCSPTVVAHLGINMSEELPVPVLDVHAGDAEGWAGTHVYFTIRGLPDKECPWGHLIVRNLNLNNLHDTSIEEELEAIRQHELVHVAHSLIGLDRDMLTDNDLALWACKEIT